MGNEPHNPVLPNAVMQALESRILLASEAFNLLTDQHIPLLSEGILQIIGTDAPDTIGVTTVDTQLRIYRNGEMLSFAADDVSLIEIRTLDGNDVIDASNISTSMYIDAGTGNDSIVSGAGSDTLTGGAGRDTLRGGDGNDRINGNGGNDWLSGERGDDRIYGGVAHDWIDGGAGIDQIFGEAGDDTLVGAGSADQLDAGAGQSSLVGGLALGTTGDVRSADLRIDINATIERLSALGVNTYYYLIWRSPHDWDDLPAFAKAAASKGIMVWVYVVPWTETPLKKKDGWGYSEPFRTNYKRWALEVANLSLRHRNVAGLIIDDFWVNTLPNDYWDNTLKIERFTPQYVQQMVSDAKRVNPDFRFYPLLYFQIPWNDFIDRYGAAVDGVVIAYPKSEIGILNALSHLRNEPHGPSAVFLLDRRRRAEAGQGARAWTTVNITDPEQAVITFYHDSTNDVIGNSSSEVARVRLNGHTIWQMPTDSGQTDGIIRIDLRPYISTPGEVTLELGMYCEQSGVPETFPVEDRFDDIRIYGTGEQPWRFAVDLQWHTEVSGEFELTLNPGGNGQSGVTLPVILMPAGVGWQHRKRYNTLGTPQALREKFDLSLALMQQGVVQGMVPWFTPLDTSDSAYQALQIALAAVSWVRLDQGTLSIQGTDAPDTIVLQAVGSELHALRNNQLRIFSLSEISRIEVDSAGEDDLIDLSGILIPAHIHSGTGNDTIVAGDADDTLIGGDGNDQMSGHSGNDQLFGTGGYDVLQGGDGNDALDGGDGDDLLSGNAQNDWLTGGSGSDRLNGHGGRDKLAGGEGDDRIYGGAGDDFLLGQRGHDQLVGDLGRDTLSGGEDDDTLISNDGFVDDLFGGAGDDVASLDDEDVPAEIEQLLAQRQPLQAGGVNLRIRFDSKACAINLLSNEIRGGGPGTKVQDAFRRARSRLDQLTDQRRGAAPRAEGVECEVPEVLC